MKERTVGPNEAIYNEVRVKKHKRVDGDNIYYSFEQLEVLRRGIKLPRKPTEMLNQGYVTYPDYQSVHCIFLQVQPVLLSVRGGYIDQV